MYNSDLKLRFISEQTSSKESYMTLFETISEYEEKLQKDICTMTYEEATPVFEHISGLRRTSDLRVRLLRKYIQWCAANGVRDARRDSLNIQNLSSSKILRQMVSDPLHFQKYLNALFEPESTQTIDLTYRCFLWLAYMGLKEEEILKLKSSDVDLLNMRVFVYDKKGRAITRQIYREGFETIKLCSTLEAFHRISANYDVMSPRVGGDLVLRGCKSQPNLLTIRSVLSHRAKAAISENKTNLNISWYSAWLSGIFYRIYEQECLGFISDKSLSDSFRNIAIEDVYIDKSSVEKRESSDPVLTARLGKKVREYVSDYKEWRAAFHKL